MYRRISKIECELLYMNYIVMVHYAAGHNTNNLDTEYAHRCSG